MCKTKVCKGECGEEKSIHDFHPRHKICKSCFNKRRRDKYKNDEEHKKKILVGNKQNYLNKTGGLRKCRGPCGRKKKLDKFDEGAMVCKQCKSAKTQVCKGPCHKRKKKSQFRWVPRSNSEGGYKGICLKCEAAINRAKWLALPEEERRRLGKESVERQRDPTWREKHNKKRRQKYAEDPEKYRAVQMGYLSNPDNREKSRVRCAKRYSDKTEEYSEKWKERYYGVEHEYYRTRGLELNRISREELQERYIRKLIVDNFNRQGMKFHLREVPCEVVNEKKAQLKLKRLLAKKLNKDVRGI